MQHVLVLHQEELRSHQTDLFLSYHQVPAKKPAGQAKLTYYNTYIEISTGGSKYEAVEAIAFGRILN